MRYAVCQLRTFYSRVRHTEEADVVIAKTDKGYESLHAVYRRERCMPAIETAIASGKWRMDSWLSQVKIRLLTSEEIGCHDPDGLAFSNINTPEDFVQAEQCASEQPAGR